LFALASACNIDKAEILVLDLYAQKRPGAGNGGRAFAFAPLAHIPAKHALASV